VSEAPGPRPSPWLAVVGIGEDGPAGLGAAARSLVEGAHLLVGDERVLATIPDDGRPRRPWPRPLKALFPELAEHRGRPVCVLASGDPLWHGVGVLLTRHFAPEELVVVPAPSAFALACARLKWPRAAVECLSLHNRPLETLALFLYPGARLVALTADGTAAARAAALLAGRGWGPSRITVLARMGGPHESLVSATAETWVEDRTDDFNVLAIACIPGPGAVALPRVPGLPDEAFRTEGQITKREVRAATLAALGPLPGQTLWDVGAGSGSIGIEWLRAAPRTRAVAVEPRADRTALIAENAAALGVPELRLVQGEAPAALAGLEESAGRPDAVFVGGGLTAPGLVEACWAALPPGGRLVANTVTLEGEHRLIEERTNRGGELTRIAVARAAPVGSFSGWRPLMPVTQWRVAKP